MTRPGLLFASSAALTLLVTSGCGSNRQLQSVSVSPASADAQNFPKGLVQFTATGTFSQPPSPTPLTSKEVLWCPGSDTGVCVGNTNPGVTVDQNGVAQCLPSFRGMATILAGKPSSMMGNPDSGQTLTIFGAAHLTCP